MKKNIFLTIVVFGVLAPVAAQVTVWEDDFNDNDVSDWTLLDVDGNESNWMASGNLQLTDEGAIYFGTDYSLLSTYNIDMKSGENLPTAEENWAISPAIDLSFYSGMTELHFNAQTAIFDGSQVVHIYASTSPEVGSFEWVATVNVVREPNGSTDLQFNDYTADISGYAGQEEVYFAFKTQATAFVGYEIDHVSIIAEFIAGTANFEKANVILKQNPVAENVQLQLDRAIDTNALVIQIYTATGMLVKEAKYNETDLLVSELAAGIYFMIVSDGAMKETLKFIKK